MRQSSEKPGPNGRQVPPQSTRNRDEADQRLNDLLEDDQFTREALHLVVVSSRKERRDHAATFTLKYGIDAWRALTAVMIRAGWCSLPRAPHEEACTIEVDIDGIVGVFKPRADPAGAATANDLAELKRMNSVISHPVHVCISLSAKKGDVVRFVKDNWGDIRALLDCFHRSLPRVRKRPKAERDRFIWDEWKTRSETEIAKTGLAGLAELVNKTFPGESMTYVEVGLILAKLRKRYSST